MNQQRGQLLAGAGVTADHDGCLAAGKLDDGLPNSLDRLRAANHSIEDGALALAFAIGPGRCLRLSLACRLGRRVFLGCCFRGYVTALFGIVGAQLQCGPHQVAQGFEVDRLGDEIEGAVLQRGHRILDLAVGGDHRDRHLRVVAADLLDQAQSIAIGKTHVGQAEIEARGGQLATRVGKILGGFNLDAHP